MSGATAPLDNEQMRQAAGRRGGAGARCRALQSSLVWTLLYLLGNVPRAGGYIVLTKEGYAVEHKVSASDSGARCWVCTCVKQSDAPSVLHGSFWRKQVRGLLRT